MTGTSDGDEFSATAWSRDIDRRLAAVESHLIKLREEFTDVEITLRGPQDTVEREYRPGLTSIVYALHQDAQKRKAVTGFLLSVVSLLGVTNIIVIVAFVFNTLGSSP